MPEAVIVSAARSPIGRAIKGSLKDVRPDDLTATIVRAALDKVPELDPTRHRRPASSAAACPAARAATTWAASSRCCSATTTCPAPRSPATAPRRCRPPGWRSTRSRPARATCSSPPASRPSPGSPRATPTASRTPRTRVFGEAEQPHRRAARRAARTGTTRARTGQLPDVYIAMGQTAENVARLRGLSRQELDEFGVRSQNLAEKAINDGFWAREITPVTTPDGTVVCSRRRPARRRHARGGQRPEAGVPPRRRGHGRQLLRAQRRRRRGRRDVGHQGQGARPHPAGADRLHRRHRPLPEIMGLGPVEATKQALSPREHERSTTSTSSRSTRRSRRRSCRRTRTSGSTSTGSTSTAARSPSVTPSA